MEQVWKIDHYEITIDQDEAGDKSYLQIKDAHGNLVRLSDMGIVINATKTIVIDAPNVIIKDRPVAPQPRPI